MPALDGHDGAVLLALPREAGTPAAAAARDLVAAHLEALGYRVERQRFTFTPSSLLGFPVFGAGLGGLALLLLPLLTGARARPAGPRSLVLAGRLALLAVLAVGSRPRVAAARGAAARGRQPDRHARRRAGAPLDRGPPRHQGAGAVDGRPAGRGVGDRVWRCVVLAALGAAPATGRACRCRSAAAGAASPCWPARWPVAAGSGAPRRARGTTAPAWPAALAAAEGTRRPGHRHPHHRSRGVRAGGSPGVRRAAAASCSRDADGRQPRHDRPGGPSWRW